MVEGSPFNSETNKARQKESIYRKLYSNLLQQNKSVFQEISNDSTNDGNDAFADEKGQLAKIFNTEIANLAVGIGVTFTAFAALRFGSRFVLNQFGGQRAQALKEADVEAKKRGTERTQNIIGETNSALYRKPHNIMVDISLVWLLAYMRLLLSRHFCRGMVFLMAGI